MHTYTAGAQFFPDYNQGNTMLSQACTDTLGLAEDGYETFPSERKMFWEYNLQYSSPQLHSLPKAAIDNGQEALYIIPMLWDENVPIEYTGGIE